MSSFANGTEGRNTSSPSVSAYLSRLRKEAGESGDGAESPSQLFSKSKMARDTSASALISKVSAQRAEALKNAAAAQASSSSPFRITASDRSKVLTRSATTSPRTTSMASASSASTASKAAAIIAARRTAAKAAAAAAEAREKGRLIGSSGSSSTGSGSRSNVVAGKDRSPNPSAGSSVISSNKSQNRETRKMPTAASPKTINAIPLPPATYSSPKAATQALPSTSPRPFVPVTLPSTSTLPPSTPSPASTSCSSSATSDSQKSRGKEKTETPKSSAVVTASVSGSAASKKALSYFDAYPDRKRTLASLQKGKGDGAGSKEGTPSPSPAEPASQKSTEEDPDQSSLMLRRLRSKKSNLAEALVSSGSTVTKVTILGNTASAAAALPNILPPVSTWIPADAIGSSQKPRLGLSRSRSDYRHDSERLEKSLPSLPPDPPLQQQPMPSTPSAKADYIPHDKYDTQERRPSAINLSSSGLANTTLPAPTAHNKATATEGLGLAWPALLSVPSSPMTLSSASHSDDSSPRVSNFAQQAKLHKRYPFLDSRPGSSSETSGSASASASASASTQSSPANGVYRSLQHSRSTSSLQSAQSRSTAEHSDFSSSAHFRNPSDWEWLVDNPMILAGEEPPEPPMVDDTSGPELQETLVEEEAATTPGIFDAPQESGKGKFEDLRRELQLPSSPGSSPRLRPDAKYTTRTPSTLMTPTRGRSPDPLAWSTSHPFAKSPSLSLSPSQSAIAEIKKEPVPSIDDIIKKHSPVGKSTSTFGTPGFPSSSSGLRRTRMESEHDDFVTPTLASTASFANVSDSESGNVSLGSASVHRQLPLTPVDGVAPASSIQHPYQTPGSYAASSSALGKSGKTYKLVTDPILSIDDIIKAHSGTPQRSPSVAGHSSPLGVGSKSAQSTPSLVRARSATPSYDHRRSESTQVARSIGRRTSTTIIGTGPHYSEESESEESSSNASAYETDDSVQREIQESMRLARKKAKHQQRLQERLERERALEEQRDKQALLVFRQLRQQEKWLDPDSSDELVQQQQQQQQDYWQQQQQGPPVPRFVPQDAAFLRTAPPAPASVSGYVRRRTTSATSTSSARSAQSAAVSGSKKQQAKSEVDHRRALESLLVLKYLRSERLTRMLKLSRWPNEGLQVSLADVGDPAGLPVFVFLGLGAVRYLVGLYDEVAQAMGIRLICVDRWGLGKTDSVPQSKRGVLDWPSVIGEVSDRLRVGRFAVLAHSAGAPFAMATVLSYPNRIIGSVHLLAPWVSASVESSYNWLKYVPDRIIRTAQAAEWKMQGWKLGKLPSMTEAEIVSTNNYFYNSDGTTGPEQVEEMHARRSSLGNTQGSISIHLSGGEEVLRDGDASLHGKSPSRANSRGKGFGALFSPRSPSAAPLSSPGLAHKTSSKSLQNFHRSRASISSSPSRDAESEQSYFDISLGKSLAEASTPSFSNGRRSSSLSINTPGSAWASQGVEKSGSSLGDELVSGGGAFPTAPLSASTAQPVDAPSVQRPTHAHNRRGSQSGSIASVTSTSLNSAALAGDIATALLQASHAEATKGGAADLMCILERTSKPWGFSYTDVKHPIKVWHGDKDEKISLAGVEWMQKEMPQFMEVNIVKGAGHGLMTNIGVVMEVLESIASLQPR